MSNYVSELEQGVESFEGGEQQQQGGQQQQGSQQQGGQQGGKQEPSTDMTDRVVNEGRRLALSPQPMHGFCSAFNGKQQNIIVLIECIADCLPL